MLRLMRLIASYHTMDNYEKVECVIINESELSDMSLEIEMAI